MIERDEERYATLLRLVGSLSRLFSENDSPYVDSRFVERLFVQTTGARDLSRMDISFDALWYYDPNYRAADGKWINSIEGRSLFRLSKNNASIFSKLIEKKESKSLQIKWLFLEPRYLSISLPY